MDQSPDWDRAVFAVGARRVTIGDVLRAARSRGELDAPWAEVCRRANLDEFEADDDAAQAGSEQFRSDRDLITAEETERWLERRGLTVEEFGDYFARSTAVAPPSAADATVIPYDDAPTELRDQLRIDLILNGAFDEMTERLAWRFAAQDAPETTPDAAPLGEPARLEDAYEQRRALALTPQARADALTFLRLGLTRVELESLELESDDAAREALLCLREDGETMAEVARDGGYLLQQRRWWTGDIPAELQMSFLSAVPGEVLGPVVNKDEFQIYRVVRKIEPQLDDAEVAAQIDAYLVKNHFAERTDRYVRSLLDSPSPDA